MPIRIVILTSFSYQSVDTFRRRTFDDCHGQNYIELIGVARISVVEIYVYTYLFVNIYISFSVYFMCIWI